MKGRSISLLIAIDPVLDPLQRIAQADRQHGLARVLQQIDHAARRILQENVPSIREQVVFGGGAHRLHQALAEFPLQETDNSANLLQRKSALAQFADDGHLGKIIERIDAQVAFASRYHDAALVPPLELARADPGEFHYVAGCKWWLHDE